jgi:Zn-dependent protease
MRFSTEDVLLEVERNRSGKGSIGKNAVVLLITLALFFYLGFFRQGVKGVILLIAVLLVHELGHLAAMKLFGYRNVKMFFIPMFGAAVSGKSRNVAAWKKAIVSLAGPLPGILIGIWCLIIYAITKSEFFLYGAFIFIALNAFNLLPFFPLDGGRLLHEILFSRNRYVEMVFKILAALALIGAGLLMQAWILALFGGISLIAVSASFKLSGISKEIRERLAEEGVSEGIYESYDESIPDDIAEEIVEKIQDRVKGKLNLKTMASMFETVWDGVDVRPPGALGTTGLLITYLAALFLPVAALIGSVVYGAVNMTRTEIIEYEKEDGQTGQKQQLFLGGVLYSESELSEDGELFHGDCVGYYRDGKVNQRGSWEKGRRDGEWKQFDTEENLVMVTVYDRGRFVSRRELEGQEWKEISWEELSALERNTMLLERKNPPRGPMNWGSIRD